MSLSSRRYQRLTELLSKSKFYSEFLMKKMQSEAAKLKELKERKAKEEMAEKEEEKTKKESKAKGRGRKRKANQVRNCGSPQLKLKFSVQFSLSMSRAPFSEELISVALQVVDDGATEDYKEQMAKKKKTNGSREFKGEAIADEQPLLLTGGVMRDYQLKGYQWMATLFENGINGILADEMGLGKTIQTIALFCHLVEMGVPGPFLIVAPLSTVPNWVKEFKRFAPSLPVVLYHGSKQEREVDG